MKLPTKGMTEVVLVKAHVDIMNQTITYTFLTPVVTNKSDDGAKLRPSPSTLYVARNINVIVPI